MSYVTGSVVKELREKKKYTQKQLAEKLFISEKTVSKWETGKGLPDIGILGDLSKSLGVSVAELLTGELQENKNISANVKKKVFYVCPVCGNIIESMGKGSFSCCGITLPPLEVEENSELHKIKIETVENEFFVSLDHKMEKDHYISFISYVTTDHSELKKLYPEQNAEARFLKRGHGFIYAFCNRDGLFKINV